MEGALQWPPPETSKGTPCTSSRCRKPEGGPFSASRCTRFEGSTRPFPASSCGKLLPSSCAVGSPPPPRWTETTWGRCRSGSRCRTSRCGSSFPGTTRIGQRRLLLRRAILPVKRRRDEKGGGPVVARRRNVVQDGKPQQRLDIHIVGMGRERIPEEHEHVHLRFGDHGAHLRIAALGAVLQQVDGKPHAGDDLFPRRSRREKPF